MSALTTNYLTPSGREEAWRFTPLKRLAGLHDISVDVADQISISNRNSLPAGVKLTTPLRVLNGVSAYRIAAKPLAR